MSIRKDPAIDVLRLLENLKTLAQRPRRALGVTFGYDPDEMVMQIEKIRASLPREVKDAATIAKETDRILESAKEEADRSVDQAGSQAQRILAEAKAEAERIVTQAKLQQEQLLSESEVFKLAKAQADEVRHNAEREASQMRRGADRYAHDVLSKLEASVGKILAQVEKGRSELETVEREPAAVPVREKVKAL
ncbi:MAG: hypothetical protein JST30_04830 [Armatimonadetes bacterium]|nr:hypothetical protein [Armatimonadota bacterium]